MKRPHLMMLLVVLVFGAVLLGHLFGGKRGVHLGAAAGAALTGVVLWVIAPMECRRQLRVMEQKGMRPADADVFRARFLKGARLPAAILILLGLAALIVILVTCD